MIKRTRSGFTNDAADKIWNDHLGNNAFVKHRDQCATCLMAYKTGDVGRFEECLDGDRILGEVLDDVWARIKEVTQNQN